jgi:GT2 family glycosyltransferase
MNIRRHLLFLGPAIRSCRLGALRATITFADMGRKRSTGPILRAEWAVGLSVVIPESGTPGLLERALIHLNAALVQIIEPWEVIVVVNGAPPDIYDDLRVRFPYVRWLFHASVLGFSGALSEGLAAVRFGGVYLHNSDMALEPAALATLLPWRGPNIFALSSQIFFDDPTKRREETGWGDLRLRNGRVELFDRTPEADGLVRSSLYAGGGSSLFDTSLLRRFYAHTRSYSPFYYEDVDWGAQAWRNGLQVLFHPGSVAWHRHRATISRLFTRDEIDRIVSRNALLFDLRNLIDNVPALRDARGQSWQSLKELVDRNRLGELRRVRAVARRAPFGTIDLERTTNRVYARPALADGRPLVLVVSPFCILPPRHGGARRTWRLCEALSARWRFILLSDEAVGHHAESWRHVGPFESVHLVDRRPDGPTDRIGRIRTHSHAGLQSQLDYLAGVYQPALVQIEHVELAGLRPATGIATILTAHDVLTGSDGDQAADRFEQVRFAGFDAVIACTAGDADLLSPLAALVVPNGAKVGADYRSSAGRKNLLFAGPFRYPPNLHGLREFLSGPFIALRRCFPDLGITVLAGEGGAAIAAHDPILQQPGVTIVGPVDDVRPWIDSCGLTINPLIGNRGSSIKLIESLAAGRVCVSTRDGARGFLDAGLSGLIVSADVTGMLAPVMQMLTDEVLRLDLEEPRAGQLDRYSWEHAALIQEAIYRDVLARGGTLP